MSDATAHPAVRSALRASLQFDAGQTDWLAGLQTVLPLAALLAAGLAAGNHVAAVTLCAGAMLVGFARRVVRARPIAGVLALDALLMATATFLGSVTGSTLAVHLAVLCVLSGAAGLLTALGPAGAALGTQAIIAAAVFGRFSEPPVQALGLAGYVLLGGMTQAIAARIGPLPVGLRRERLATATAYERLAELAAGDAQTSGVPAATALDGAQAVLAHGTWFGDPALGALRVLAAEGHRLRVQLSALQRLLTSVPAPAADEIRQASSSALAAAARALGGDRSAGAEIESAIDRLAAAAGTARDARIARRADSLAGQLRSLAVHAPAAGTGSGLRERHRQPRTRRGGGRLRPTFEVLRANAGLDSPAGRHAVRLAIVVPLAALLARSLPLQRSYWIVVAAAAALRPDFGATFTRGAERLLGTLLGVSIAGALAALVHPAPGIVLLLVTGLGWCAFATFRASFALGFGCLTALVVLLLDLITPDTFAVANARLLDTLVGGALGLVVYLLWPTWSAPPARRALAVLTRAQRRYVVGVIRVLGGEGTARDEALIAAARGSRRARSAAEAAIAAALSDPARHRLDDGWSRNVLAAGRRLVQGAHVLRLELEEPGWSAHAAALGLADRFAALLAAVADRVEDPTAAAPAELPDLREAYRELCAQAGGEEIGLGELDEMVDAAGGLAALVGLDPAAGRG